MKNTISVFVLLGCLLCGCTIVQFDSLVPSSVLDYYVTSDSYPVIKTCSPSHLSKPQEAVSDAVARVQTTLPPELRNDAVVNHVLAHAKYVHANAQAAAKSLLKSGSNVDTSVAMPKPSSTLTHVDIDRFAKVVSNQVLRHTPATNPNDPSNVDPFWQKLRTYYIAYYDGNFNTYFGENLGKPTVSLTITDTEIVQAARVFIELLMDEVFGTQLWLGSDKKTYYPGGNTNKPTSLTLTSITTPIIPDGPAGCGMNVAKANAMRYLAQAFSKAASTETGLTVKSAGSLEVGLGIVGKLSIGDNTLLTALVQGLVSEIVARLTVQVAAPILEAIDFEKQTFLAQASSASVQVGSTTVNLKTLPKTQVSRIMTSVFVSGKATAM